MTEFPKCPLCQQNDQVTGVSPSFVCSRCKKTFIAKSINKAQLDREVTELAFRDHAMGHNCNETCEEWKQLLDAHKKACKELSDLLGDT